MRRHGFAPHQKYPKVTPPIQEGREANDNKPRNNPKPKSRLLTRIPRPRTLPLKLNPPLQKTRRHPDNIIINQGPINQKRETENLQPLESFPAKPQTHNPDKERPTRIDCAARGRGNSTGY